MKNTCKAFLLAVVAASTLASSDAQAVTIKKEVAVPLAKAGLLAVIGSLATRTSFHLVQDALHFSGKRFDAKGNEMTLTGVDKFRYDTSLLLSGISAYIAYKAFKRGYYAVTEAGLAARPNTVKPKRALDSVSEAEAELAF